MVTEEIIHRIEIVLEIRTMIQERYSATDECCKFYDATMLLNEVEQQLIERLKRTTE